MMSSSATISRRGGAVGGRLSSGIGSLRQQLLQPRQTNSPRRFVSTELPDDRQNLKKSNYWSTDSKTGRLQRPIFVAATKQHGKWNVECGMPQSINQAEAG